MKILKRLLAVTVSTVLLVSAVPVFAEELSDKIYVSNAIKNTLKMMNTDMASEVYEEIAKNAYTQKLDITLKDYTLPVELLEKDIFDGYSISNTSKVDPNTFNQFNNFSFKNPRGEALSLNYIFSDSLLQMSMPEIMDYYVEMNGIYEGIDDETISGGSLLDLKTKNQEIVNALENLTKEIEVKVIGSNKADVTLTEAKVTLKAESLNKFVNEYMGLYPLAMATEKFEFLKNDITIDLLINKENIITGFSTVINETFDEEIYEYDEETYDFDENIYETKTVTTKATISIKATYNNDKMEMDFIALEDDNEIFSAKVTNQDVRDSNSKIISSKTNIVASAEKTSVTMEIDTLVKADGSTEIALICETVTKAIDYYTEEAIEDIKHKFTLNTSYKTVVGEKEIKIDMPNLDITIDDMVFNLSLNYGLSSSEFVLPEYTSVKFEAIGEEETTELTNKLTIQAIKVLPEALVTQLMQ